MLTDDTYALEHHKNSKLCRIGYNVARSDIGIAQFINDSIRPKFPHEDEDKLWDIDISECKDIVMRSLNAYLSVSLEKENVKFIDFDGKGEFWCYSTRNIMADEELFFSYGIEYWLSSVINKCEYSVYKVLYAYFIDKSYIDTIESFMNFLSIREDSQQWLAYGISNTAPLAIKVGYLLTTLGLPISEKIQQTIDDIIADTEI